MSLQSHNCGKHISCLNFFELLILSEKPHELHVSHMWSRFTRTFKCDHMRFCTCEIRAAFLQFMKTGKELKQKVLNNCFHQCHHIIPAPDFHQRSSTGPRLAVHGWACRFAVCRWTRAVISEKITEEGLCCGVKQGMGKDETWTPCWTFLIETGSWANWELCNEISFILRP